MKGFKIELDFNEVVEDMFCDADFDEGCGSRPATSFSEAVKDSIVSSVSRDIKSQISASAIQSATKISHDAAEKFISSELEAIVIEKLKAGEVRTRFNGVKSFDDLIENYLSASKLEQTIERCVSKKADEFAKEMKARYDNVFAAKVVGALSKQKMLSPEISKLLLGDD